MAGYEMISKLLSKMHARFKDQAALGRSIYVFLILHDLFFGDK